MITFSGTHTFITVISLGFTENNFLTAHRNLILVCKSVVARTIAATQSGQAVRPLAPLGAASSYHGFSYNKVHYFMNLWMSQLSTFLMETHSLSFWLFYSKGRWVSFCQRDTNYAFSLNYYEAMEKITPYETVSTKKSTVRN